MLVQRKLNKGGSWMPLQAEPNAFYEVYGGTFFFAPSAVRPNSPVAVEQN